MSPVLPYGRQSITSADIEAVIAALESDFLTTGPMVERFERAFADYVGAREAVVVANGTAALHLAIMAQGLGPSDVVIVPSITFVASANAVAYCGAQVVFCDVDPETGLMTDQAFDQALGLIDRDLPGYRFAGVVVVHYAGYPVDLEHISQVCRDRGAFVIEDACHAVGTRGPQGPVGSCVSSDMACFSFHPVKTMTTGEGGMVTLNDSALTARLRLMRSHGVERATSTFVGLGFEDERDDGPWVYEMQTLGYNYRLPDLNCALGLSQLGRMPEFAARRQALGEAYERAFAARNLPLRRRPAATLPTVPVAHLCTVLIDFDGLGTTRTQVMSDLRSRGIGTQVHYVPVHRQPFWVGRQLKSRPLPGADAYYSQTLSLPLFVGMTDDDPALVVGALGEVLNVA